MDVAYAIDKVYVTERDDVIKCHSNVIIIWRKSAIEVTALFKMYVQKWKVCKKNSLSWVWGVDGKIRPRDQSLVSRGSDPLDEFFYLSLAPVKDFYNAT